MVTQNPGNGEDATLRQEAQAWIIRLTSGAATDADAWHLSVWRNLTPAHEAAFRDAVRLWHRIAPAAQQQRVADIARMQRRAPIRRRTLVGATAFATATAAVLAAGTQLDLLPSWAELNAEYRTRTGQIRRLVLADGSVVEMNTQTGLSVDFTATERGVILAGGEATFAVTPDPTRPFVVVAAGGRTRVLGTVFDIYRNGDQVCVTCLEGKVQVERQGTAQLLPKQQITYTGTGLQPVQTVDPDLVTSWRRGLLLFRDRPLRQVVDELNRYRRGHIILTGATQVDQHVSGVFHLDRLDEVLAQIEQIGRLRSLTLPGGILLLR